MAEFMSIVVQQHQSGRPAIQGALSNPPGRRGQSVWDAVTGTLLAVAVACLLGVSRVALGHWLSEYRQPESYYAYAPVIPFLVALMLWHRREALRAAPLRPSYGALAVLAPALALLVLSTRDEMPAVMGLSFLLTVWSGLWLVLGTRWIRAAVFPLAFLLWMCPLPGPLLSDGTFFLQQVSTQLAVHGLHLLLFQPALSGNVITLDDYTVFVDAPCSGFKLLLSLLTCSAALAYLLDGSPRRRVGLFLFSVPLALVVNAVRLILLCIVGECFGARAGHLFHDWDGLLTLGTGAAVLLLVSKRIGCRTFAGWPLF